jgi:hypothetical protein
MFYAAVATKGMAASECIRLRCGSLVVTLAKSRTPTTESLMRNKLATIAALSLFSLAACGNDKQVAMPDVETQRLDVALSDISRAGYDSDDVEIVGGGAFGVVDESNWSVCDQDPAAGDTIGRTPRLIVERTCQDEDRLDPEPEDQADAAIEEEKAPSGDEVAAAKAKKNRESRASAEETFVMPDLAGMNLQDAQDTLQTFGSYLLTQTDATGMERFQMLDSNWKVCYQVPRPGTKTPLTTLVDLGAVKLDESC